MQCIETKHKERIQQANKYIWGSIIFELNYPNEMDDFPPGGCAHLTPDMLFIGPR